VLAQFGGSLKKAKRFYRTFIEEGFSQGRVAELTGGGLRRSHGGWSEVVSLKRKGVTLDFDDRVLGDNEFLKRLQAETDGKPNRQLKLNRSTKSISDIIAEQSAESGISQKLLISGSRRQNISQSRAVIAKRCTEELGMTFADIARALGVTTSAISRAILRFKENN
jgi:putative transposase